MGKYTEAKQLFQGSLADYKKSDDQQGIANCLNNLGITAMELQEYAEARQLFEEALTIYRENGDQLRMANTLGNLGYITLVLKDYGKAKQLLRASRAVWKEINDPWEIARVSLNLGFVAERLGEYDEAKQFQRESLKSFKEVGDLVGVAKSCNGLGFTHCALEEYQEAKKCFSTGLEIAIDVQTEPDILTALVGRAILIVKEDESEFAAEIIVHILHHPSVDAFTRCRAESVLFELESQLSPQAFAAAQKKGKARDLEYYVQLYSSATTETSATVP
jgi:tetratricopeptide (TPR) repeat protein